MDAVDPVRGRAEPTAQEICVEQQAASRSGEVVLLADASKLGPADLPAFLPLEPSWTLPTDGRIDAEPAKAFATETIRVLTAG